MGVNKLLLRVDGETLVRRVVSRALAAGLAPVIVVVGHERERVEQELAGLACRAVFNPKHAEGQHTSFQTGIGASARGEVVVGEAVDEITKYARKVEANLIVVGHKHLDSWAARWWRGSISGALIEHAPCSVLVVITQ